MRAAAPFILLAQLPYLTRAITFDCKNILADGVKWDLGKLDGMHHVSWIRPHGDVVMNTTFTINPCQAIKPEDVHEKAHCDHGTRLCAVEYIQRKDDAEYVTAWPIVREYIHDGAHINPQYRRIKSELDNDEKGQLEGVTAELEGGVFNKQDQKAVINFTCIPKDEKERRNNLDRREGDDDDKDEQEKKWKEAGKSQDGAGGQIEFVEYSENKLVLDWFTPFACENAASEPDKEKKPDAGSGDSNRSGGWGFFSWFFFLLFMLLVIFIIFTAWINYSRNGARGWDLLPFSDTLRDLPYILGDWSRKIMSTLGGGSTRGGYSAV